MPAKQSLKSIHDGMFRGYASLFDMVDLGQEVLTKGAFKSSLIDRGAANVRMLFQHNPDEPIGHWAFDNNIRLD
ncbi:MAG: HK97 family phage prohead protease [Ahrensia sp.]|nr:HK97 family phage prohead protease [Ahrensia sp.]